MCAAAQEIDHGLKGDDHNVGVVIFAEDGSEFDHNLERFMLEARKPYLVRRNEGLR